MSEQEQQWALVEVMGHQRIAGAISEYNLGGSFIRVDVPAVNGRPAFTRLFGPQAIYAISFVDQAVALALAEKLQAVPVQPYEVGALTSDAVRQRLSYNQSSFEEDDEFQM